MLVAFLVIVVQGSDVLQYVFGKLFGCQGRALAVAVQDLGGLVGGVASATALGAGLWWLTPSLPYRPAPWPGDLPDGLLRRACLLGDQSATAGQDWGRMIEGHGGMLDRLGQRDLRRADLLPPDTLLVRAVRPSVLP